MKHLNNHPPQLRTKPTVLSTLRIASLALLISHSAMAAAANWPGWRGPAGTGFTQEKGLPLKWDGKSGENILWKASLKGMTGHSSPIIWGDRVFVTTANRQTGEEEKRKEIPEHHLFCFQASDGKLLWRTPIVPGKELAGYSIYASPTPVTKETIRSCEASPAEVAALVMRTRMMSCLSALSLNAF